MNFILIALGDIPDYLNDCIQQIKKTQKKSKIYLLVNKTSEFKNKNCKIVNVESLKKSKEHILFIKKSKLAQDSFRNFFWKHSIERFYYLNDFLNKSNLTNVFHIENDVLLFQDLEKILKEIKFYNFACIRDSINRVIGSLIFIKNKKVSTRIVKISNNYLNENDMKILNYLDKKISNSINLPLGETLDFIEKSKIIPVIKITNNSILRLMKIDTKYSKKLSDEIKKKSDSLFEKSIDSKLRLKQNNNTDKNKYNNLGRKNIETIIENNLE